MALGGLCCARGALARDPVHPAGLGQGDPLAGLGRWGSGEFRRFGFLIYEVTLWAAADPSRPPLALRLDYRRTIAGRDIARASEQEIRRIWGDDTRLGKWTERMSALFPDVRAGDHILGVHRDETARFYLNGRLLGEIDEAGFASRFFAIWLDPRTSAPELRSALLRSRPV